MTQRPFAVLAVMIGLLAGCNEKAASVQPTSTQVTEPTTTGTTPTTTGTTVLPATASTTQPPVSKAPTTTAAPVTTATCPNGSYINSSGKSICSPAAAAGPPAGATAQCVDGVYSFSQHRSGTCSGHGGVARWL